jgi:hypothetical protein
LITAFLAGCTTSGAPSRSDPPTPAADNALKPSGPPPAVFLDGVRWPDLDVCAAMQAASKGSTVVIQGNRAQPIDMGAQPSTAPDGRCHFAAAVPDVTVSTSGSPLLLGELTMSFANGWTFDGIAMTPTAATDHKPMFVMVGGDGFHITNCELFASASMAELNIGNWTGAIPTNFRVDHCYIHDNGGWTTNAENQNDNAYIFTGDGYDTHGIIEDNVFVGAPRGFNVKIGGTGLRPGEGSDGITFRHNTLVNDRIDGVNLLISTDSDNATIDHNVFDAQGQPGYKVDNVELGSYTGSGNMLSNNVFWGYDPDLWPHPRPILYSYQGLFQSIDLNEATDKIGQQGNVRFDPGYPALGASNPDHSRFGAVTVGGETYGARW